MANQYFKDGPFGKATLQASGGRRPTIAIMGDSYGGALELAIQTVCMKAYPADIDYDMRSGTQPASGGRAYWVGGTSSAHMVSTQLPQWQANPSDVVFIWTGKNETPNSTATAASSFANVKTAADTCIAAGANLVVLMGFGANGAPTASGMALGVETYNALMRNYARANDRIVFVETQDIVLDVANATSSSLPFLGVPGAYKAHTHDGTHWSDYAVRAHLSPRLEPILRRIAGVRRPRVTGTRAGAYNSVSSPEVNLLGDSAYLMNSASGWFKAGGGGADCTLTTVPKGDGFTAARLNLTGTTTSGTAYILFAINAGGTAVNNGQATRLFDGEALIDFYNVQGLVGVQMRTFAQSANELGTAINYSGSDSARYPDGYTETDVFLYNLSAVTHAGNNPNLWLQFSFANNQTLSGAIEIRRPSWQRVAP